MVDGEIISFPFKITAYETVALITTFTSMFPDGDETV
jgi:hypothetical protein